MASSCAPFKAIVDPDAFLHAGGMPERIAAWCASTGQTAPATPGEFVRAILESLALRYRQVLENLELAVSRKIQVVHHGGGSRNRVLNQFVADATGRLVVAGPSEATAAGNVLVQAIGSV